MPGQADICWNLQEIFNRKPLRIVAFAPFSGRLPFVNVSGTLNIQARNIPSFMGRFDFLKEELKNWWSSGYEIFLICDGEKRAGEMEKLFQEQGVSVSRSADSRLLLNLSKSEVETLDAEALKERRDVFSFPGRKGEERTTRILI